MSDAQAAAAAAAARDAAIDRECEQAVLQSMMARGAEPDATLLHRAVRAGATEALGTLLSRGTDVNTCAEDGTGKTALHVAAERGELAVARLLLERGAAAEARDAAGLTPLMWAARTGHDACVVLLLERGNAYAASSDAKKWTALHWAAALPSVACVRALLAHGAAADAESATGKTPLTAALWSPSGAAGGADALECCRLLLAHGAPVSPVDVVAWRKAPRALPSIFLTTAPRATAEGVGVTGCVLLIYGLVLSKAPQALYRRAWPHVPRWWLYPFAACFGVSLCAHLAAPRPKRKGTR
jgi:ankyrin repeat protein